jgi:plastocyanin
MMPLRLSALPVAAVVALAGVSTACASTSATATAPLQRIAKAQADLPHVTIVGNDRLRFVPSVVRVHVGKVRITLRDSGAYPHNIVIPALKVTTPSVTGDPGGTVTTVTVDFRHKGRYRFYCQYHQSAGMVGTFVVS